MQIQNAPQTSSQQSAPLLSEVSEQKPPGKSTRALIFIGFIIIIGTIGVVTYNLIREAETTSAENQIQSVLSGNELSSYRSNEDNFTISMPGSPEKRQSTATINDATVPVTTYERSIENGAKIYSIATYDYSDISHANRQTLEAALSNSLANTAGAQVVSKNKQKYQDYETLEATYNIGNQEKLYESHVRYIMKDSIMYVVTLIGGDQNKFSEFANSLKLQ